MNIEEMTEREKSLLIAEKMYGKENVRTPLRANRTEKGVRKIEVNRKLSTTGTITGWLIFNPYKDGNDSQAVQEFFKIDTCYHDVANGYWAYTCHEDEEFNASLKTAIADCAVRIIMDKNKHD